MSQQESTSDALGDFISRIENDTKDITRLAEMMDAPLVRNEVEVFRNVINQPNSDHTILRSRYDALMQSNKIALEMKEIVAILRILLDAPDFANLIFDSIDRAKQKHNTEMEVVKH